MSNFETVYTLSQDQLSQYDRDGYLILRDFCSPADLDAISAWTKEVHDWPNIRGKWMHYEEVKRQDGQRTLCRTENFVNFHRGFEQLLRGKRARSVLQQLGADEEFLLFKEKINYKNPGAGGFDAHQDAPAYQHAGTVKHLTINMAVDAATTENGCLEVVDGSHKIKIPIDANNCIEKEWEQAQSWRSVPLESGDVLIFGSFLAHRSGPNDSAKSRAAIYATYNAISDGGDRHDAYYADRREHWPPTWEREEGKSYELGALRYGFGSPMDGAQKHSRMIMEHQNSVAPASTAPATTVI